MDLAYKFQGKGEKTYLLVHNAGGDHKFLDYTASYLSSKGRVLSIDLRGHGKSEAPEGDYTVASYADDVARLCQKEGLEGVIFVGLNFGACVGIELASRYKTIISKLILIEPPILMEPWIIEGVKGHIKDLQNVYTKNYAKDLVSSVLTNGTPKEIEMAVDAFEKTPRHVQISTYQNLLKWDLEFSKKGPILDLPVLYIQTSKPFTTEEKMQKHFTHLTCSRVVGSGPWVTIEVPDQVHAIIERFCSLYDL